MFPSNFRNTSSFWDNKITQERQTSSPQTTTPTQIARATTSPPTKMEPSPLWQAYIVVASAVILSSIWRGHFDEASHGISWAKILAAPELDPIHHEDFHSPLPEQQKTTKLTTLLPIKPARLDVDVLDWDSSRGFKHKPTACMARQSFAWDNFLECRGSQGLAIYVDSEKLGTKVRLCGGIMLAPGACFLAEQGTFETSSRKPRKDSSSNDFKEMGLPFCGSQVGANFTFGDKILDAQFTFKGFKAPPSCRLPDVSPIPIAKHFGGKLILFVGDASMRAFFLTLVSQIRNTKHILERQPQQAANSVYQPALRYHVWPNRDELWEGPSETVALRALSMVCGQDCATFLFVWASQPTEALRIFSPLKGFGLRLEPDYIVASSSLLHFSEQEGASTSPAMDNLVKDALKQFLVKRISTLNVKTPLPLIFRQTQYKTATGKPHVAKWLNEWEKMDRNERDASVVVRVLDTALLTKVFEQDVLLSTKPQPFRSSQDSICLALPNFFPLYASRREVASTDAQKRKNRMRDENKDDVSNHASHSLPAKDEVESNLLPDEAGATVVHTGPALCTGILERTQVLLIVSALLGVQQQPQQEPLPN